MSFFFVLRLIAYTAPLHADNPRTIADFGWAKAPKHNNDAQS